MSLERDACVAIDEALTRGDYAKNAALRLARMHASLLPWEEVLVGDVDVLSLYDAFFSLMFEGLMNASRLTVRWYPLRTPPPAMTPETGYTSARVWVRLMENGRVALYAPHATAITVFTLDRAGLETPF